MMMTIIGNEDTKKCDFMPTFPMVFCTKIV